MKYRKKPVVVEAVKVIYAEMTADGPEHSPFEELPEWLVDAWQSQRLVPSEKDARDYMVVEVKTLEGTMEALPGDYIIRGIQGELYPVKPDVFEATYEPVESDDA